jgi:uncharacterized membrane protein HdeD (DUF308 family)
MPLETRSATEDPTRQAAIDAVAQYLSERAHLEPEQARQRARELLREGLIASSAPHALMAQPWWMLGLRGLLAMIAGALLLLRPVEIAPGLIAVFGAWIFADGIVALIAALTRQRSWYLAFAGLIGIALGAFIILHPLLHADTFYVFAAAWIMGRGTTETAWGAQHTARRALAARIGLIAFGVLSFVFGMSLLIAPLTGVVPRSAWVGAYALVFGGVLLCLALPVRMAHRRSHRLT